MDDDELPIDVELSRDADKIVTATLIRIDCRRCGDWTTGVYRAAVLGHRAHMEIVHGVS